MRSPRPQRRRLPRAAARALALAAMLAVSGVASASASGQRAGTGLAGTGAASERLAYICRFPSGPLRTAVRVTASFPAAAAVGRPIQPTHAALTVTVPAAGVAGLPGGRPSAVAAVGRLVLDVSQPGRSGRSTWTGLASPLTPAPASGPMPLRLTGAAPPIVARRTGKLTVAAAGLLLDLAAAEAADPTPSPSLRGPAAIAPTTAVHCVPAPGPAGALAVIPVTRAARPTPSAHHHYCPKQPKGGYKRNPRFPLPKPPPGSTILHPGLEPGCAYTTGYADVRKLKEAGLLRAGLSNLSVSARVAYNQRDNYFQSDNYGTLYYHGQAEFPPSQTTFLAFGFMPTTATLHLREVGTLNAVALGPYSVTQCKHACPTVVTISSRLYIRVSDVTVNGVPLDVGSACGTSPFDAIVTGSSASKPPYTITGGGPLGGVVSIPDFSGCGVGENLDPLFTGAISGTRNFTLLTQGKVCFLFGGGVCPPTIPKPLRSFTG